MGGAVSLPNLLFDLKHLSTEVHRLLDGSDGLGANEPRCQLSTAAVFTRLDVPQCVHHQCLCPQCEPQPPLPLQETGRNQQGGLAQAPIKLLLLFWVPVCLRLCVCLLGVKSLFPPVLQGSWLYALLVLQSQTFRELIFPVLDSRLRSLMWGSELFLCKNLYSLIIPQFVGYPPGGYGIWVYCESAPPGPLVVPSWCI